MECTTINMEIEVAGSDDGKETFCISRKWDEEKKKSLIIELYPAITAEQPLCMDKSAAALINHADAFGWGSVKVINLYSTVFTSKPLAAQLHESPENMQYIEDILDDPEITEYEIVIAWGSSLYNHAGTNQIKRYILNLLLERGLLEQTKHIVTEMLMTNDGIGTHPLYLALRHSSEEWVLQPYPLEDELERLDVLAGEKEKESGKEDSGKVEKPKRGRSGKWTICLHVFSPKYGNSPGGQ